MQTESCFKAAGFCCAWLAFLTHRVRGFLYRLTNNMNMQTSFAFSLSVSVLIYFILCLQCSVHFNLTGPHLCPEVVDWWQEPLKTKYGCRTKIIGGFGVSFLPSIFFFFLNPFKFLCLLNEISSVLPSRTKGLFWILIFSISRLDYYLRKKTFQVLIMPVSLSCQISDHVKNN